MKNFQKLQLHWHVPLLELNLSLYLNFKLNLHFFWNSMSTNMGHDIWLNPVGSASSCWKYLLHISFHMSVVPTHWHKSHCKLVRKLLYPTSADNLIHATLLLPLPLLLLRHVTKLLLLLTLTLALSICDSDMDNAGCSDGKVRGNNQTRGLLKQINIQKKQ